MKESKRLVFFFFYLHTLLEEKHEVLISYATLYQALTLAPSTIRGIIVWGCDQGYIRNTSVANEVGFILTQNGRSFVVTEFPGLENTHAEEMYLCIFPKNPQGSTARLLRSYGLWQIRAGIWAAVGTGTMEQGLVRFLLHHFPGVVPLSISSMQMERFQGFEQVQKQERELTRLKKNIQYRATDFLREKKNKRTPHMRRKKVTAVIQALCAFYRIHHISPELHVYNNKIVFPLMKRFSIAVFE